MRRGSTFVTCAGLDGHQSAVHAACKGYESYQTVHVVKAVQKVDTLGFIPWKTLGFGEILGAGPVVWQGHESGVWEQAG